MPAGTVALTNGSTAVTGTSTALSTELAAGDFMIVTVGGTTYTLPISAVASATSATLASAFTGTTTSGLSYTVVKKAAQMQIPAQIMADAAQALRTNNQNNVNWSAIFTNNASVTVTAANGQTYTGPGWLYIAANSYLFKGVPGSEVTDVNSMAQQAGYAGIWNFGASAQYNLTNVPETQPGILEISNGGSYNCQQKYTTRYGMEYSRALLSSWDATNPNWSEWIPTGMSTQYAQISTGSVNDIIVPGRYSLTNAVTDIPLVVPGMLEVKRRSISLKTDLVQEFHATSASTANGNRKFIRVLSGSQWVAWVELFSTKTTIPVANGGTGATTVAAAWAALASYGTTAGTAAQGNDSRLNTVGGKTGGTISSDTQINGSLTINGQSSDSSGNVTNGITITSPSSAYNAYLQYYLLSGQYHSVRFVQNSTQTFTVRSNGAAYAVSFNPTSDSNLKFNKAFIADALENSMKLRGMTYLINGDDKAGVIAQDAEAFLPESVTTNTDPVVLEDGTILNETKSLDYGAIVGVHTEALKEIVKLMLEVITDPDSAKSKLESLVSAINTSLEDENKTDLKMGFALVDQPKAEDVKEDDSTDNDGSDESSNTSESQAESSEKTSVDDSEKVSDSSSDDSNSDNSSSGDSASE